MKCSIIRRVSTEQQAEKISLTEQLKRCEKTIQERGWNFVRDFNFGAAHGSELRGHPLYLEIKKHIENNGCDVLLTAVLDRTLRDTAFWIDLCELLQKHKKKIATPSETFDPANLEHELTLNIKSSIGHYERKKIRERSIMGLNALKDKGGWTGGRPPFGYYYDPTDKEKPLKIEKNEAEILRRIFEESLKFSKVKVCEIINKDRVKFRSRDELTPRMVRRFLETERLRFYAGMRLDSKGNEIKGTWDPIIDKSMYGKLLKSKENRTSTFKTNPAYLLTGLGIFRCGYCDLSVKTAANRQRENWKVYYYCSGYYRGRDHCKRSKGVHIEIIDKIVIDDIIKRVSDAVKFEKGYKNLKIKHDSDTKKQNLIKNREELNRKKERLMDAVENGLLSYVEIENRMNKIRGDLAIIESELIELSQEDNILDVSVLREWRDEISNLPSYRMNAKREIIKRFIKKIVLYEKSLHLIYNFPVKEDGSREVRINLSKKG